TPLSVDTPGRPGQPRLVDPSSLPRRRLGSESGRAALIHAIAHIEFNAINLALDAAHRFRDLPESFTMEWISVAADEARHFQMLEQRLSDLGKRYGDFPAHNGLWEMAVRTAGSCLERMALVPRVLEARGLDVTPGMIQRLQDAGDHETVAVLQVILEEEVRHVAIGSHWFRYCCERAGLEPLPTFVELLDRHFGRPRGPFNIDARLLAGFTAEELEMLEGQVA
ncbi:MAG: ferritin-like domain-containing protein, partial [Xanthomonadales bacterium]|nr:ferritin-like domain-containing protein [Xanthomonadales bacterium]